MPEGRTNLTNANTSFWMTVSSSTTHSKIAVWNILVATPMFKTVMEKTVSWIGVMLPNEPPSYSKVSAYLSSQMQP